MGSAESGMPRCDKTSCGSTASRLPKLDANKQYSEMITRWHQPSRICNVGNLHHELELRWANRVVCLDNLEANHLVPKPSGCPDLDTNQGLIGADGPRNVAQTSPRVFDWCVRSLGCAG
jgi:hypothetical protein